MGKDKRRRLGAEERRADLLRCALGMAERGQFAHITAELVAERARCSTGLIRHHFGGIDALRDEVLRWAIDHQNLKIIAQGLALQHPLVMALPVRLRRKAALCLAG